MKTLKIISRVDDNPTEYDGAYLVSYDPDAHTTTGDYDGGKLTVSKDRALAKRFPDAGAALELWRISPTCKCHALRPWDGKPNRPLTAYHCAIDEVKE